MLVKLHLNNIKNLRQWLFLLLSFLVASIVLTACGGGSSTSTSPIVTVSTHVSNGDSLSDLAVGDAVTLAFTRDDDETNEEAIDVSVSTAAAANMRFVSSTVGSSNRCIIEANSDSCTVTATVGEQAVPNAYTFNFSSANANLNGVSSLAYDIDPISVSIVNSGANTGNNAKKIIISNNETVSHTVDLALVDQTAIDQLQSQQSAGSQFFTVYDPSANNGAGNAYKGWCGVDQTCNQPCQLGSNQLAANQSCTLYIRGKTSQEVAAESSSGLSAQAAVGATNLTELNIQFDGNTKTYQLLNQIVLYVGGYFDHVEGKVPANKIASWDGSHWMALADGIKGNVPANYWNVSALASDGSGNLIVGGDFDQAGTNDFANNIALWNGSSWQGLSYGVANWVESIMINQNGEIYIGGNFKQIISQDTLAAIYIAKWDLSNKQWLPFDNTPWQNTSDWSGQVRTIVPIDNGNGSYVGGAFLPKTAMQPAVNGIATFDEDGESEWGALNSGFAMTNSNHYLSASINAAAQYNNKLYVAGVFNQTNDGAVTGLNNIAVWNGSEWQPILGNDSGIAGSGSAIATSHDGDIYVGGTFNPAMGAGGNKVSANNIVVFKQNGADPQGLGSTTSNGVIGENAAVNSIIIDGSGQVYVGGSFTVVNDSRGSHNAFNIAKWNPETSSWSILGSSAISNGTDRAVKAMLIANVFTINAAAN